MSTSDDFRKKAIHKQIDSNRNIRKVVIPHNVQIGRKNKSINKETLQSLSGTFQLNEFIIRKDQKEKFTRLELNNGHKTSRGTTIRFACGGVLKGSISQSNVGDLSIKTYVDDIRLDTQDSVFIRDASSTSRFKFDTKNKRLGVNTTSPSKALHVVGTVLIDCEAAESSYGTHIKKSGGNSSLMIKVENEDASATAAPHWGIFHQDDGDFTIGEAYNDYKLHIQNDGDVAIGTSTPSRRLHVTDSKSTSTVAIFDNTSTGTSADGIVIQCGPDAEASMTTNNTFIFFQDGNGDIVGRLRSDSGGGGVALSASFTGAHVTVMPSEDFEIGLIVESTGVLWANHVGSVSTALPSVVLSSKDNSKNVYGVISEKDSHRGMQKRWGVPEGKSQVYVNGLGEGKVWVTNRSGDLANGDYITTSEVPGHGMKQSDDILRNYTVGKCVESVDWTQILDTVIHDGVEYKKYLIGCTYHCS
ncbi:hypothetical protein OAA09_00460 [bacterium]|nr:hypothetical protein [bacterium]